MTPEEQALRTAIETLYHTFASYHLPARVDGCPCCVSDENIEQIHRKPLRELTADDLSRYAFKAMTTWGSVDDYKHFLPRLLELITDQHSITDEVDVEVLLGKLTYAHWQTWPQDEQDAVGQFLIALWHYLLTLSPEAITLDEYLCGFGQAVDDLSPFLNIWESTKTDQSLSQLIVFVDAQSSLHKRKLTNAFWSNRNKQMVQVVDWLLHLGLI